jgi:hypothetical protein
MTNENMRGFNGSDRQVDSTSNEVTCPTCRTPIFGFTSDGPGEHFLAPCGHRVTSANARGFAGGADQGRGVRADGGTSNAVTERGKFGDTKILLDELDNSFQEVDDAGNVKAKVWESDAGARRLYIRVRDHDNGRRFEEYSVDLGEKSNTGAEHGGSA